MKRSEIRVCIAPGCALLYPGYGDCEKAHGAPFNAVLSVLSAVNINPAG
jgi:hypothetical protein